MVVVKFLFTVTQEEQLEKFHAREQTGFNEGTASKYTRSRLPVKLAAVKGHLTKREVYPLEYRIKKMPTHKKKIATLNDWKPEN